MNNLKRVLSMALASVMLVGMMAVGASAMDFTDADEIQYANAVEILVALKVINGKDDGSFDPKGDVTRGEMAKMIAVAMNGGNEANAEPKAIPSFTDIGGHWAESYIEFCTGRRIISGRGDGTFAPNEKVTGLEAAKMVLTALGYDAKAFELTGENWAANTDEWAKKAKPGLFEGMANVQMAKPASREVAAQIIWNGLQNRTRAIDPSEGRNTGEVTWGYGLSDTTMLFERYGANIWVGTYEGNFKNGKANKAGEIAVKGCLDGTTANSDGTMPSATASFPSDMGIENIGEEVKVIFKDGGSGNTANKPDSKDTIYGVFNTGATQVIKTTRGLIKDNLSAEAQINVDGTLYDVNEKGIMIYTNYVGNGAKESGVKGTDPGTNRDGTNSPLTKKLQGNQNNTARPTGDTIKLVADDDGIYAAYIEETYLGVVTAANSSKVTISSIYNAVGSLDVAANDIYEGAKAGDVVAIKTLYNATPTDAKAYNIVTKADVVSGTVDSFDDTNSVVVDGSSYEIYKHTSTMHTASLDNAVAKFEDANVGEDFDLYLVNGYVAAAVQTSEGSSNYSVIVDSNAKNATLGSSLQGVQIVVMDAEGVRTTLTVSTESYKVTDSATHTTTSIAKTYKADLCVGAIVTYSMDKNGDAEVTVEALPADATEKGEVTYKSTTKTLQYKGTHAVPTNAVMFTYIDANNSGSTEDDISEFKAYNLRNMGDNAISVGGRYAVALDKDGAVKAVYYNDNGIKPTGATDNTVYGIVSAKVGNVKIDGTTYVQYKVAVNEDTYTVNIGTALNSKLNNASLAFKMKKGAVVRLEPTSDNIYTEGELEVLDGINAPKDTAGYTYGFTKEYNEADQTVTIYGAQKWNSAAGIYEGDSATSATYAVASDVKIYYVDQASDKGVLGAVGAFDAVSGTKNIVLVIDKEQVVTAIIFEVSNKWDILNSDGV